MTDAVLTPHINPYTCGTGKWSGELARQLGVPLAQLDSYATPWTYQRPLVSARLSEIAMLFPPEHPYDLIVHDWDYAKAPWVIDAQRVWAVTPELVRFCATNGRPDAQLLPCPSSLRFNLTSDGRRLLIFGMAHKRQLHWLLRLRDLLKKEAAYTVYVSTAVHEGSPFDRAMLQAETTYRELFGDHLRMMGYLADDALVRLIDQVDACALFFDPAARANNTTLWAALDLGCPVITNLDDDSPREVRGVVLNVAEMGSLRDIWAPRTKAVTPQWSAVVEALACPVS